MRDNKKSAIRLREIADKIENKKRICPQDFVLPECKKYGLLSKVAYSVAVDDAIAAVSLASVVESIVREMSGLDYMPNTAAEHIKGSLWELRRNIRNDVTTDFGHYIGRKSSRELWVAMCVRNIRSAAELLERAEVLKDYVEILHKANEMNEQLHKQIINRIKKYPEQLFDRE